MNEIDWSKFAINYRNYLRRTGAERLAGLLTNAEISYERKYYEEDQYVNCLNIRMANSLLHLYDETDNSLLLKASRVLIPDYSIGIVNVGSLLDELSEDGSAVVTENPIFGSPSPKAQFLCDVFVIMPFASEFKPIYDDHIASTVKSLNLSVKRGDDFFSQHSIMQDVWSALNGCRLVVAECTGRNPNVFYELGIAHTLAKPVILITQTIDDIPFDLRHLRHITYSNKLAGANTFKKDIEKAIQELLPEEPDESPSPKFLVDDANDIPF